MDDDCELRELVAKTLENNGTLAKLRAQLRASVFLALEEQDFSKEFVNKSLQEFVSTPEGVLITCLVREFLECFGLDVTLSVFDPETGLGNDYELRGRKTLIQQLGLNTANGTGNHKPLLAYLLTLDNSVSKGRQSEDKLSVTFPNASVPDAIKISEPVANAVENHKTLTARETSEKSSVSIPSRTQEAVTLSHGALLSANKGLLQGTQMDDMQPQVPAIGSSAVPLSTLPPLLASDTKQLQPSHSSVLNSDSDLENLKAMINMNLDYEEDFNSSGSGQEKSPKSLPVTESDIEEEIDDIDDVSNISAGEEISADKSGL